MRTRLVKPGFFTSETLGELPALTRLLFVGLWCLADKEGRLLDRPRQIKAQILPYEEYDVSAALDALQAAGHIKRYEADSLQIIEVVNFKKHQTLTSWEKKETEALPQDFRSTSKGKAKRVRSTSSSYIDIDNNPDIDMKDNTSGSAEAPFALPTWLPLNSWNGWLRYRKEIRKPIAPSSFDGQVNTLSKLRDQGFSPEQVIQQSIDQSWVGLFPVKTNGHRPETWTHEQSVENALRMTREAQEQEARESLANGHQV